MGGGYQEPNQSTERIMSKGLLCKLGIHRYIYTDAAMFTSGRRCGVCNEWINKADGEAVDRERAAWDRKTEAEGADLDETT